MLILRGLGLLFLMGEVGVGVVEVLLIGVSEKTKIALSGSDKKGLIFEGGRNRKVKSLDAILKEST